MDIPYNTSSVELTSQDDTDTIMQTAIGQGKTQITPMHLNMITAAIANDGTCMKPYVVDRIESATGTTVKKNSPSALTKMMTEEEASFLRELMTDVVNEGTATKLKGLSYTAAGKTGSAEYSTSKDDSHAWFTGFAPAENPQVCVTVIVESAGSGGDYAVPIAKRVFDQYFTANEITDVSDE
jgi:peptidoglycan glycosyltransferase